MIKAGRWRLLWLAPVGGVVFLATAEPAHADGRPFSTRASLEWIAAVGGVDPSDTALNPGNITLAIPQLALINEWRPNVRVEFGPRVQLVVRPRARVVSETVWQAGRSGDSSAEVTGNATELYVDWKPTDWLGLTYGLQNFQWGPTDLVGPSNRLFHEVALFRDPLYYVKGHHIARVNLSFGRRWSVVSLAEVGAVSDVRFLAGERFARSGQVKAEFATTSGAGYVGLTVGGRDGGRPWIGEYFSMELAGGWSVYADVTHARGSRAWYPRMDASGSATFAQSEIDSSRVRTFGVAGLRYAFVAGTEARVEYIHQDAGWSRDQFDFAAVAAATAPSPAAAEPFVRPGLELLGRRLVLGSVRLPDLGPGKRVDVQARHLRSFTDDSSVTYVNVIIDATDALIVFVSAAGAAGRDTAEFSRFVRGTVAVGVVRTW